MHLLSFEKIALMMPINVIRCFTVQESYKLLLLHNAVIPSSFLFL